MAGNDLMNYTFKIAMAGTNAVGKTSLIRRFVLDTYDDKYIDTIGTKITRKEFKVGNKNINLNIWDISGGKQFRHTYNSAFAYAKAYEFVTDVTRPETVGDLEFWLKATTPKGKDNPIVPYIFIGNKTDMKNDNNKDDVNLAVSKLESLSEKYEADLFLTSAKEGNQVENAFGCLAKMVADFNYTGIKNDNFNEVEFNRDNRFRWDLIMYHFRVNNGDAELAMDICRKQANVLGMNTGMEPTRDQLVAFINKLSEAEKMFKDEKDATKYRVERMRFVDMDNI